MRSLAAVQTADRTLEFEELPVPERLPPGAGLLRIEACGMCGTDYEQYEGALAQSGALTYPVVPGHEPVGTVVRMTDEGSHRWGVREGDRVIVESFASCGTCLLCVEGHYPLCERRVIYGFTTEEMGTRLWGGFSEYLMVHPRALLHRIPDDMSAERASLYNPLGAGFEWTLRDGGLRPGDSVLVLGAGQRGLACVIAARESGADGVVITGLGRDAHKLDLARQFGASAALDVEEVDIVDWSRDHTNGRGFDIVIDAVPYTTKTVLDAIRSARRGGTVVVAGLKGGHALEGFTPDELLFGSLTLRGAYGVRAWAYREAIRLLTSDRYDWSALTSHAIPLPDLERGLGLLSGAVDDGTPVTHVTVLPPAT